MMSRLAVCLCARSETSPCTTDSHTLRGKHGELQGLPLPPVKVGRVRQGNTMGPLMGIIIDIGSRNQSLILTSQSCRTLHSLPSKSYDECPAMASNGAPRAPSTPVGKISFDGTSIPYASMPDSLHPTVMIATLLTLPTSCRLSCALGDYLRMGR